MTTSPTAHHDRFFKEVFSEQDVARDFLSNYLPAQILELLDLGPVAPSGGLIRNRG
ncbi:MAG: Rpn family recombination-promoting nuclease/putative transposase [Deltaproteobacteria bacterium]|nr:Rpn family recombination-promoting nuclease/putative transposase [Deltaproteobacteria bacterium]